MTSDQVLSHFRETDALLEGHFLLSSGLHAATYLQCALALQYPTDAARFGRAIADRLINAGLAEADTVASPAIGGLVIGFSVAQALNKRFIWTERQDGKMTLRRGFALKPGEQIIVIEDVITTGGSTRECITALTENGGTVTSAASIVDRSNGMADVGVPRIALAELDVPGFEKDVCPMCLSGSEPYKPGSRTAASK